MPTLIITKGDKRREVPLDGTLTIGRHSGNAIQIAEEKASRQHARISSSSRGYVVEDLNSSNGTLVNGVRVSKRVLRHGDRIEIGATSILFHEPDASGMDGKVVAGKYRIRNLIGQGGMGAVYLAHQPSMDRLIALKLLKPELSRNPSFVDSFIREAKLAAQLDHPAIVRVYDFGEMGDTYYIAMEYVDGRDLQQVMQEQRKLALPKALHIAVRVAEGLDHAHSLGIMHRDIKPQNIMLDGQGRVKLADLGLAKAVSGAPDSRAGVIMGTPHYLAPEVGKRESVDGRADIYSLGATLFHLITGRVPFDGPNSLSVVTKHINQPLPSPKQYDVTIPDYVCDLIFRLMAKDPECRPASAGETARAIETTLEKVKATAKPARKVSSPPPKSAPRSARPAAAADDGGVDAAQVREKIGVRAAVDAEIRDDFDEPDDELETIDGDDAHDERDEDDERAPAPRSGAPLAPLVGIVVVVAGILGVGWVVLKTKGIDLFGGAPPKRTRRDPSRAAPTVNQPLEDKLRQVRAADREGRIREALAMVRAARSLERPDVPADGERVQQEFRRVQQAYFRKAARAWREIVRAIDSKQDPPAEHIKWAEGFMAGYPGVPQQEDAQRLLEELGVQMAPEAARWQQVQREAGRLEQAGLLSRAAKLIQSFVESHPDSKLAPRARKRLDELRAAVEILLAYELKRGEELVAEGKFVPAAEKLVRVISEDFDAARAAKAREAMDRIDRKTQAHFDQAQAEASAFAKAFTFKQAADRLAAAAPALVGTRWEHPLRERLGRFTLVHKTLLRLAEQSKNTPRAKRGKVSVLHPEYNRQMDAYVVRIGPKQPVFTLQRKEFSLPWNRIAADEQYKIFSLFMQSPADHLGVGVLFAATGQTGFADVELSTVLADPALGDRAARYLAPLKPALKLHSYDWSSWREQEDWQLDGDWSIQDGRLQQQAEGIESTAMHQAETYRVAGGFHLSFDLTVVHGSGLVAAELVQDESNVVGVSFDTDEGYLARRTVDGAAQNEKLKTFRLQEGKTHRVRLSVTAGTLACSVDGTALPTLDCSAAMGISGHVRIKTYQVAVQLDNIQIRAGN